MKVNINLIVLRCICINKTREFYEKLGFSFQLEKHGAGPEHYAASNNGFVLELYPLQNNQMADNVRLGFTVPDLLSSIKSMPVHKPLFERGGQQFCLFKDPDGRIIECSEGQ
jgi:lactoylglutathione lyase